MATFMPHKPSKLTLEQDGMIYEAVDPSITLMMSQDCVTIEARCWNMKTTMKEDMETEPFSQEPEKKKTKIKTRKDRFPKDGGKPIRASVPGYSKIPWTMETLTLIAQTPDGKLRYAKTMEEKRALAWANVDWILVAWPGKYSQDIFLIDDMKEFRKALGYKPVAETVKPVVTDEDGEEWVLDALFEKKPSTPSSYPTFYKTIYNDTF